MRGRRRDRQARVGPGADDGRRGRRRCSTSPGTRASSCCVRCGSRPSARAGRRRSAPCSTASPAAATPAWRSTSPPPAWPGFRRLAVTAIERESDSVISDPPRGPRRRTAPAAAPRASTSRCASSPSREQRSLLRNYSLSGPPDAGYYRIAVKREPDGAASGYLHTRLASATSSTSPRRAARSSSTRTDAPVLLISAGIGATPVLAMLHALADASTPSARSGGCTARAAAATTPSPPRPARSSPRSRTCTPTSATAVPGPDDLEGRDFDSAGRLTASLLAELAPPRDAEAYLCGPGAVHGRDQRRPGRDRARRRAHPHRAVRAGAGPDARHRRRPRRGRRTRPPARPEAARRSSSPAATSPSRGAATTAACSSSPRPATCPSAGRAAPASATTARRRSSPATLDYGPDPVEPPADGSALICCSQPRDDVVLDL